MKEFIKLEEAVMFFFGIYLFQDLDISWVWFLALILAPDIGMLGYLINSKVGAITYNIFHHKGIAILIYFSGVYLDNKWVLFAGIILFAHSSLDRVFGYGLKYFDNFKHTHLGQVGKK